MDKFVFILLLPFILTVQCVPIEGTSASSEKKSTFNNKKFTTEETIYENGIKTVRLFPISGQDQDLLKSSIIHISQTQPLILQFDEVYKGFNNYNVELIHCNHDWSISQLNDIEYLYEYNRFPISEYESSFNTKVNYTHYRFEVPKVKISGNYLLKLYRGENKLDLILTKRFCVFEDKVLIKSEVGYSSDVNVRRVNQQLNFDVLYPNFPINNPREELKIVIRQNQRWDNALLHLKPMYIKEDKKEVQYRHFNRENNFKGGNEFRAFDLQNIRATGLGIDRINNQLVPNEVELKIDLTRSNTGYVQYPDLNGKYYINNLVFGNGDTEADYANITFNLETQQINNDIYVFGEISDWKLSQLFKMKYNEELKRYQATLFLKQGYYNYVYAIKNENLAPDLTFFEGSHYNTSNEYEIMVYYRPIGARADILIGYADILSENF